MRFLGCGCCKVAWGLFSWGCPFVVKFVDATTTTTLSQLATPATATIHDICGNEVLTCCKAVQPFPRPDILPERFRQVQGSGLEYVPRQQIVVSFP